MQSEPNEHKVIHLQLAGCLLVEDGNHGEYRPRPNEFGSGDTAFIRAADMEGGRILFESADKINDVALARITKGIGRGGDILFSHKGTVGKLAVAPLNAPPFVCSPQTTFWRTLDEERLDRRYLYYFMRSRRFWEQWHSRKGETDMADYVSLTAQRELFVVVPHIDEQRTIARILGALDDKIELNRQMNRTLEAMAQALFKSWFVDFDPVRAKAEDRVPYGMDANTAALFPNAFEDSELGEIPKGWGVKTLGELCDAGNGSVQTGPFGSQLHASDYVTEGVPVVMPVNLGENRIIEENVSRVSTKMRDNLSRHILSRGDIIYARRGDIGRKAYVRERESGWLCGTGCLRIRLGDSPLDSLNLSLWLGQEKIKESLISQAVGTTMPNLNTGILRSILVLIPSSIIQNKAAEKLHQWDDLVASNDAANLTLASLRDLLLPKLLSGDIRVRQAENLVAEAV